jgi:hypothetical protein
MRLPQMGLELDHRYPDTLMKMDSTLATPANAPYMAMVLIADGGLLAEGTRDSAYLEEVGKSYGVDLETMIGASKAYMSMSTNKIVSRSVSTIKTALAHDRAKDPLFFAEHILLPYLMFISRGYHLSRTFEDNVNYAFHHAFLADTQKINPLEVFVYNFREDPGSSPGTVRYLSRLNRILSSAGLRIHVDINSCTLYKILGRPYQIDTLGRAAVLLVSRFGLYSLREIGVTYLTEKDVVLVYDQLWQSASDLFNLVKKDTVVRAFQGPAIRAWDSMHIPVKFSFADTVYRELMRRQFRGMSEHEILRRLILNGAVHEIKHRWDFESDPGRIWLARETEVSAHLAEAIYGGITFYSLFDLINRMQSFYVLTGRAELKDRLVPLIYAAWHAARDLFRKKITKQQARSMLAEQYNRYKTVDDRPLPPLDMFEDQIIKPYLCMHNPGTQSK